MADDEKFLVVPLGKKSKAITQTVSNDTAMEIMELLADGPMSTSKVAETLGIPLTTAQYNIEKLMEAGLVKIAKTRYSEKGREVKLYEAMNRAIVILPGKSGAGAVMEALRRYIVLLPIVAFMSAAVEYLVPLAPSLNPVPPGAGAAEKGAVTGVVCTNSDAVQTLAPSPAASPSLQELYLNYTSPAAAGAGDRVSAYGPAFNTSDAYTAQMPVSSPVPQVPANVQHEVARSAADQAIQGIVPYFHHAGVLFFAGCLLVLLLLIALEYVRYKSPRS